MHFLLIFIYSICFETYGWVATPFFVVICCSSYLMYLLKKKKHFVGFHSKCLIIAWPLDELDLSTKVRYWLLDHGKFETLELSL